MGAVCLTDGWKGKSWDNNEKERDEKETIEERYLEEDKGSWEKREDVNGKMLGKEVKYYTNRTTNYCLCYIRCQH